MSSRREFLKDAGVAAGAATVAGYVSLPESVAAAVMPAGSPEVAVPVDPSLPPSGELAGPLPPVPTPKCTPAALAARGQIAAKVDQRLLTKANRLFGGTAQGRVTEMLQNSRRAGATTVWILYDEKEQFVRYFDDGHGLTDFGQLLSLGFSGWDDGIEAAEDPAGAGFFSLSPREVTVHSRGKKVTINEAGWLGMPIDVVPSDWYGKGVQMEFHDEWPERLVEEEMEFGPLTVYYNGRKLRKRNFIDPSRPYSDCPELGCRIQLRSYYTPSRGRSNYREHYVNFNFHGQTLASKDITGVLHDNMRYYVAVELTGAPTELRMVLPAREKLLINNAAEQLKHVIEKLIYQDLLIKGNHNLPYNLYLRGKELGFALEEANESWVDGVGDWNENCSDSIDFPHRIGDRKRLGNDSDQGKTLDLLAGYAKKFQCMPCEPNHGMAGYSWAKFLPRVQNLEIFPEYYPKKDFQFELNGMTTRICKSISVEIETDEEDGSIKTYDTPIAFDESKDVLYVTKAGIHNIDESALFAITGGNWCDDRSYDAQFEDFDDELADIKATLKGPFEANRRDVVSETKTLLHRVLQGDAKANKNWDQVLVKADGTVQVLLKGVVVATVAEPKEEEDA